MREIKSEKVWETKYTFGDEVIDVQIDEIARDMDISRPFAVLLHNRGYHSAQAAERFLKFEENDFHDPFLLADMDKAVDRILYAVEQKQKICVYGDYDVDGVTSVSMFYLYLKKLGADVTVRIPKRDGEGYGVSFYAVEQLAVQDIDLVITVDTGITANEEVEYADEFGVDFVITDHHECRNELPKACAVVNPHRPDCPYPFKDLAGVGVVFKVICACEIRLCQRSGEPIIDGIRRIAYEYADLAAVGTVADVMPVVDENRLIIKMGLSLMEKNCRPGLDALIEASTSKKNYDTNKKRKMTSRMIGFGIAPRINAAGRISDAMIAVRLLLEEDRKNAEKYAEELCDINRQRQAEENRIAEEAYGMIEKECDLENDLVIVLDSNYWQQGIIGIVSSRITEKYGLPSILISFRGSCNGEQDATLMDDGKGSGRSIKGMNLVDALAACDDLLVKYGGHELAAGLTVKRVNLGDFRKRINEYAREHLSEDVFKIHMEADCELNMRDLTMELAREIMLLEPCGTSNATGNATPAFIIKNVFIKRITGTRDGNHTILLIEKDGICLTGMYYGISSTELGFAVGDSVDLFFNLEINDYKNVQSVQLIIKDARMAEDFVKDIDHSKRRYEEVRKGGSFLMSEDFVPSRDDFARLYTVLRREYRSGISYLKMHEMLRMVNQFEGASPMNYTKCKYILRILNELKICEIDELQPDLYSFSVVFNATKTNIDKSSILRKLKGQCADRVHRDAQ